MAKVITYHWSTCVWHAEQQNRNDDSSWKTQKESKTLRKMSSWKIQQCKNLVLFRQIARSSKEEWVRNFSLSNYHLWVLCVRGFSYVFCLPLFLCSIVLRFLFAIRVFDPLAMALCLWWESEKTHVFFNLVILSVSCFPSFCWTGRYSPGCSQKFVLRTWLLYCCLQLTLRFRRVRCFRDSRSLRLFYLDPVAIDLSLVETCECFEDFLLSILTDSLSV